MPKPTRKQLQKINPDAVADEAEDLLEALKPYRKQNQKIPGLPTPTRLKTLIKKIDQTAREIIRLENKIDTLHTRRALTAHHLTELLDQTHHTLRQHLDPEDYHNL